MKKALEFCNKMCFALPPFVYWGPDDWKEKGAECNEIRDNQMGWDITDFGSGDFPHVGLVMITLRNGNFSNPKYLKPYAEKLLIVDEGQVTPMHYHYKKCEDIINRGGGNLILKLYNKTADSLLDNTDVIVSIDGVEHVFPAGNKVRLKPGESICMVNGLYHTFWGEPGFGKVLIGEVSNINDDTVDNHFHDKTGRFPEIEEDEPALHLLYTEYPKTKKKN
jgi:D-lyxose ketol-isomerase